MASLATLYHVADWSGIVWIVGDSEDWFPENPDAIIRYIPSPSVDDKFKNIQNALLRACKNPEVSEQFYYSNDDIYITADMPTIPPLYCGHIDSDDVSDFYHQSYSATETWLERHLEGPIYNYEAHAPLPVVKKDLEKVLTDLLELEKNYITLQLRTMYGNIYTIGGDSFVDAKEGNGQKPSGPIVSTSEYRDWLES